MTNPGKMDARKFKSWPYSVVRDAEANIEKWRMESPPERTLIIQKNCQPLLKLLDKISFDQEYSLDKE